MESEPSRRIIGPLAHRIPDDADAALISDAIAATWQEIAAALRPVIGQLGVAALYRRSLYLAGSDHPWLAGTPEDVPVVMDLPALKSVVAQQTSGDAIAGGSVLLQTFYELLSSLIGPSLTERLLVSVWTNSSGVPTAQDVAP